jgi:nucleoside-diphosphate-sugar epimerase
VPLKFITDRPGQIKKEQIRAKKAKDLLGWEAKTSMKEGLKLSYEWMKSLKGV